MAAAWRSAARPEAAGRPPVQAVLTVVASVEHTSPAAMTPARSTATRPAALVRELAHTLGLLPRPETRRHRRRAHRHRRRAGRVPDAEATRLTRARAAPAPAAGRSTRSRRPRRPGCRAAAARSVTGTAWPNHRGSPSSTNCPGSCSPSHHPPSSAAPPTCPRPPAGPAHPRHRRLPPHRRPATDSWRAATPAAASRLPHPAARCDLDHNDPYPAGPTSATTRLPVPPPPPPQPQAPAGPCTASPTAALRWTTPGGDTITTHPPRYGTDDDLPPPPSAPPSPGGNASSATRHPRRTEERPRTLLKRLRGRGCGPGSPRRAMYPENDRRRQPRGDTGAESSRAVGPGQPVRPWPSVPGQLDDLRVVHQRSPCPCRRCGRSRTYPRSQICRQRRAFCSTMMIDAVALIRRQRMKTSSW